MTNLSSLKFFGQLKRSRKLRIKKPDIVIEQVKKVLEDRDQQLILMVRE